MFIKNITIVTNTGDTIHMENVSESFVMSLFQKYNFEGMNVNTEVDPIINEKKEETYYEKRKKDPKFIEEARMRAAARYHAKKNDPEFKAAAKAAAKRHYEKIKEERIKVKEERIKVKKGKMIIA